MARAVSPGQVGGLWLPEACSFAPFLGAHRLASHRRSKLGEGQTLTRAGLWLLKTNVRQEQAVPLLAQPPHVASPLGSVGGLPLGPRPPSFSGLIAGSALPGPSPFLHSLILPTSAGSQGDGHLVSAPLPRAPTAWGRVKVGLVAQGGPQDCWAPRAGDSCSSQGGPCHGDSGQTELPDFERP